MSSGEQHENYNNKKVLVRYKFKNERKEHQEWMSYYQYNNLKQINMIKYCEIISKDEKMNHD